MPVINNDTQAILLLTSYLVRTMKDSIQPLTTADWNRLALWLQQNNLKPGDLLSGDPAVHLSGWSDSRCSAERLLALLGRGIVLGIALEKWQRAGIWVLSRMDGDYPVRLKDRLKGNAPPILYGCGNHNLLKAEGVAVVGSRKATEEDLKFAFSLGESAAQSGLAIVSGGARGIDETAMSGAMQSEGTVVGVLADSLLRASASQRYRQAIQQKNAVLISPYWPEAPFNVGNAMGRNKYIYCLAESAIVVHSGRDGGTWNGAVENLKKQWVPLWVKHSEDKQSGNEELVRLGARWLPENVFTTGMRNLPRCEVEEEKLQITPELPVNVMSPQADYKKQEMGDVSRKQPEKTGNAVPEYSLYELFCVKLKAMLARGALNQGQMEEMLGITTAQMKAWLRRAQDDGLIGKRMKPVRYELPGQTAPQKQPSLF